MKFKLTLIALIFFQFLFSQNNQYNVYEIGKGEILKKNYYYLEYFYDNLLIAVPLEENIIYDYADLTGIINLNEEIKFPFIYRNIEKIRDDYKLNKKNIQLIGVSNGKGRALFELKNENFKQITEFNFLKFRPYLFNGDYLMAYNGYCQLLELNSGQILKTKFIETEPLTNELVATKNMDYYWGVINKKGDTILTNSYDRIYNLSDSIILFKKRDSIGVLNSKGQMILPPIFSDIDISNSIIIAQTFNNGKSIIIDDKLKLKLGKWSSIIKNGKERDVILSSIDYKINQNGLFGGFDYFGNLKIPFKYLLLEKGIKNQLIANKDNKYGIISEKDEIVEKFIYNDITLIFGLFYKLKYNGKTGLITSDKTLFDSKYVDIFPISNTKILIKEKVAWYLVNIDSNYKIVSKEKTKLNPKFSFNYINYNDSIYSNDFFSVKYGDLYGVIDKNFKIVIPINNQKEPNYFNGKYFNLDKYYTKNYTKNGVLLQGIDLSRNYYDDNHSFINTIICKKNEKYGVIDINGKVLIPFQYTYIQNIDGQRFIVQK